MISEDKVFFNAGELVQVKHKVANISTMWVIEKVTRSLINKDNEKDSVFVGIKCRWFADDLSLQEGVFSTKDLIHV